MKWSYYFGQFCGLSKMHLVCVHAAFRISAWPKYAMSGVRLSRAVCGRSEFYMFALWSIPSAVKANQVKASTNPSSILMRSCPECRRDQILRRGVGRCRRSTGWTSLLGSSSMLSYLTNRV